ncbi:MAG: hypothetical protein NXI04_15570 [Planctomycetaceae bacterium]|nr:hypothetical protein [Planctomycetaceae bacterium]
MTTKNEVTAVSVLSGIAAGFLFLAGLGLGADILTPTDAALVCSSVALVLSLAAMQMTARQQDCSRQQSPQGCSADSETIA